MQAIRDAICAVVQEENPVTVRQVFYRLVSAGVIGKTESEYKATVVRLLTEMRLAGTIPFDAVADNTRWIRRPLTFPSMSSALHSAAETYRRSLWDDQDVAVGVWLEKDALAGVLYQVTWEWDVPLLVTRGYPSVTFLHEASQDLARLGKPAHLYYFGDHDPSGLDIPRNVEDRLREFAPEVEIHFECVAVTEDQIREWDLPTRPTKKTDSRSKGFRGESVEVDAIPPAKLRTLTQGVIERHVDQGRLDAVLEEQREERDLLIDMADKFDADGA